jgi:hypothetical protein
VRDGRTEEGHDRVADELLDSSAVALKLATQAGVVGQQKRANVLRVHLLRAAREPHEVREEHADDLAFLARCRENKRRAAARTELRVVGVLASTLRAGGHDQAVRVCSPGRSSIGKGRRPASLAGGLSGSESGGAPNEARTRSSGGSP